MTQKVWANGEQRFTATIKLAMGLGLYDLTLQLPDKREGPRQLRIGLLRLGEAWAKLESALTSGTATWSAFEPFKDRKRRKNVGADPE